MSFENLLPDTILFSVENALGQSLTSLISPFPSYINRVYELCTVDGIRVVAKFYRPGRWSRDAIIDEHNFLADCEKDEIPVVPPLRLKNGSTLEECEGIFLALFPKRSGRQIEINDESDWIRLGSLIARMHLAGEKRKASARVIIDPSLSTANDIEYLCDNVIPARFAAQYRDIGRYLIDISAPLVESSEKIRIHGDCHRANIMDRLEEGYILIDFDDMAMGPAVQDIWLLLPDRADACKREIELFLEGYERFRFFDRSSLRCIESLRAMRMIYFLSWCSRQADDYQFRRNFPEWGSDVFWQKEIGDLREQIGEIETAGY
ncbi:serine/threonine protein kinase [Chitinispirillum alkaliphilum]|nr:serine/threonine protein kinase [Chitinispirillum alkaliphilum]